MGVSGGLGMGFFDSRLLQTCCRRGRRRGARGSLARVFLVSFFLDQSSSGVGFEVGVLSGAVLPGRDLQSQVAPHVLVVGRTYGLHRNVYRSVCVCGLAG